MWEYVGLALVVALLYFTYMWWDLHRRDQQLQQIPTKKPQGLPPNPETIGTVGSVPVRRKISRSYPS